MAKGFALLRDGVTVTLEPQDGDSFAIVLSKDGHEVRGFEGDALLDDPASLGTVIDGIYADLQSAEHQHDR